MLSCKEVTRKIASDELVEAGWRERLAVRLHLIWCRHCRRYVAQLRAIGAAARNLWGARAQNARTIERLERQILEGCLGGSGEPTRTTEGQGSNVDPK